MSTYFFTADQHFGHANIIKYCSRPFQSSEEMDEIIIRNFNQVVKPEDITIHAGDFTLTKNREEVQKRYVSRLRGTHIFLNGSHDNWLRNDKSIQQIYQLRIKELNDQLIVACHYAMHVWPQSHYNSWHVYGHSHGRLQLHGKSYDVGVDNNYFYPVSLEQLVEIMRERPDNPNLVKQ